MRFYGGDPMTWLAKTPLAVVRAHVAMLERLTAEEALLGTNVAAVGRALDLEEGEWVRRQMAQWTRAAGVARPAKAATPADLSAIGIGFTEVPVGG